MSGKGGGGAAAGSVYGKGNSGISAIPAGSRKMVQSLKEIVNCPEPEIYAMLKDCNMDPNEAVNRLLSQDPFHEVKSKREKKKENKDITDPRSRTSNSTMHRGGRGSADRYGRGSSNQLSNDHGVFHGKPAYSKENGAHAYTGSSSTSSATGNNINRQPVLNSDLAAAENKTSTVGARDGVSLSSQPHAGFQSTWVGVPGQISMADIVKMGRPQNKVAAMPAHHNINNRHPAVPPVAANNDFPLSESHSAKVSEIIAEPEVTVSHHGHSNDEWPSIEPSAANDTHVIEAPSESELHTDPSNLPLDRVNQLMQSQLDGIRPTEDDHIENLDGNHVGSSSISSRNIQEDGPVSSSMFDSKNMHGNLGSYQPHRHDFDHEVENGASSVAANLQQLSLQDDDQSASSEEDNPSVKIPNHLQVHAQDCSHLSFGSFGTGISSTISGSFASRPMKNNLEETSEVVDVPSTAHLDARNTEYYGDEHLRNAADENLMHRAVVSPSNYDSPAVQKPELLKESTEAAQGDQYAFPSSAPGYTYDSSQQLNAAYNNPQTSSQMQNITPFSSVMQAYTNSLPSTLLASTVQPGREPDLPYSPFPVAQSVSTKYSNPASSIGGPSISMPEPLRAPIISTSAQPAAQNLPGANVATLQQHLAVHPYSQHTLPLGHFANMIGYPFLPQSYTYMPSAFQQAFAGNSSYHQSLAAAVLPQYKNSVSVSSLPQSAAVASAYGFGSSTNIPGGNFSLNPPSASGGTTLGYDDVLSSQYKDSSHLISLQQNDNSGMWVHGPGQRTMSAVPASTYYSFQGQNQQPAGFRQGQQVSQQHLGALGYPNYYHNQTGMSLEHEQQQNSRDGSLGSSHGQPAKQSQQLWQNSY